MPTKKSAVPPEIYQLKVTLLGTMPPIWRRLLVPADLTLAQLHDVLQSAMGWQDCHMHEFSAGHRHFGKPNPEDRLMGMPPVENERTVRLSSLLSKAGAKVIYTYDMGDGWEHGIVLEKRLPVDPGTAYPVCTGGERACPPEDCGGIPGFYDLLDALGDPTHEQHDELQDWIGDDYDPNVFTIDQVNQMLTTSAQEPKQPFTRFVARTVNKYCGQWKDSDFGRCCGRAGLMPLGSRAAPT